MDRSYDRIDYAPQKVYRETYVRPSDTHQELIHRQFSDLETATQNTKTALNESGHIREVGEKEEYKYFKLSQSVPLTFLLVSNKRV